MESCNLLIHRALGGGNFAQAKLVQYHHVLIRRRILSYFYMIMVAFFMLSSTACSSDEETEKSEVFDYKTTFLAHEWQILHFNSCPHRAAEGGISISHDSWS